MNRLITLLTVTAALLIQPCARADVFARPASVAELRAALAPATQGLQDAQSLRGAYDQLKQLHELPRPLASSGRFLFLRDSGIAWTTVEPFASELVITRDHLIQREGGNEIEVSSAQQPAVQMVAEIFFAVFSLDFDTLGSLFELYGGGDADGRWTLGLRPKQAAGSITSIRISGGTEVEQVVLSESSGDTTRIQLHDVRISAQAPGAADYARFATTPPQD
jgi:outer membrane lipoprotein-sorting protein